MKQVSDAYRAEMKSAMRNQSLVKVAFSNIDTEAGTDGTWSSSGAMYYSDVSTLDYTYDYGSTYATLELNRWSLDAKSVIIPSALKLNYTDGFISKAYSGTADEAETVTLTRSFSETHNLPAFTLVFDTREEEYPKTASVYFYLNDSLAEAEENVPITGTTLRVAENGVVCDKIVVELTTSLPYRRARVEQTIYGVVEEFTNEEIVSTKQSHDVDPLSRRLPTESMSFTILDYEHKYDPDNPKGVYQYIDTNAPVTIRFGYTLPDDSIEWIKADRYVLNGKPTASNNQATFTGTGLVGSLSDTFYKSQLGTKNLYDMAIEVLQDANLTLTDKGANPWDIDESLQEMYTDAVLPIDTHMNCLQLIAHAACCQLYTDDDNIIHIEPFGVTMKGIYAGEFSDYGYGVSEYSEFATLDKGNTAGNTYATLELNRWSLDGGEQVIIADDSPTGRGYISENMCGTDSSTVVGAIERTFEVLHDLPAITIRFDDILNEYPASVTIAYYKNGAVVSTKQADVSNSEVTIRNINAVDCDSFVLLMRGGLPYHRLRVSKIYYRETDYTLNFTSITKDSQSVSKIDQLKSVSVAKYNYTAESTEAQTLYEGTTTDTQMHIEFSSVSQDIEIAVTGGTLVSSEIYARAVDLVLSSGTKSIVITGTTLTENSVVVSYPVSSEGEIDAEENPLITNDTMCDALANHISQYLQMRNTYESSYRGNPELETGDIIGLQTLYTDEMDALILVDEITFNGSLSGKLKVKGLI